MTPELCPFAFTGQLSVSVHFNVILPRHPFEAAEWQGHMIRQDVHVLFIRMLIG
jgi:hypothetical protein